MDFDNLERMIIDNQKSINRLLSAIQTLKEQQDKGDKELKDSLDYLSDSKIKEILKESSEDICLYTIKEGEWYFNNKPTGIKAIGKDGQDGKDGKDGKDGLPGKDGKNGQDGKDGKDGKNGLPGKDGKNGLNGLPGKDGKNGKDVDLRIGKVETSDDKAYAKLRKEGDIVYLDLKLPKGPQGFMGFDGKDGKPGEDGKDGTINGYNDVTIEAGDNIKITQKENKITISVNDIKFDLTGYATEKWVKDQDYMPIPDFMEYINYFYYDTNEIDEMLDDYYLKEEIDSMLKDLPTGGGTALTGGDNTVIEDNAINVYTNTGYKVIDKDIQLQTIKDSGTSGTTKMVYIDGKEIIILYDGTIKIRRSENGIDFKVINLPCSCKHLVYNADDKRLYGTDCSKYFIYSDDYGLTWKTISQTKASSVTMMAIGYGSGFRTSHKSTKEIISWTFNENTGTLAQNTRITSTIVPEFSAMVNNTQFVWCNANGTFRYGAGSNEGNFPSVAGAKVSLLKRVNNTTFLGLKNDNRIYLLESATSITKYAWIEYSLPDTCTVNDIIFNPYDETYYLFTDINTYYKTKDFANFEPVDKNGLRGVQGYFTLMGVQVTTSNHNELLLAPTRTKIENKLQEHDRDLNKSLWVGNGLELTEEGKVNVKINGTTLGVSEYGIYIRQIEDYNLPEYMLESLYVAVAEEKDLFDPYELENWFYGGEAYPEETYKAVKFLFSQAGSFYNQVTWEEEYIVEQYEVGYLFYDVNFNIFKYVKLGNKSWMFNKGE